MQPHSQHYLRMLITTCAVFCLGQGLHLLTFCWLISVIYHVVQTSLVPEHANDNILKAGMFLALFICNTNLLFFALFLVIGFGSKKVVQCVSVINDQKLHSLIQGGHNFWKSWKLLECNFPPGKLLEFNFL